VSSSPPDELARYFGAAPPGEAATASDGRARFEPNFNVAPSADVLAVYEGGDERRLRGLRWGLVPGWAKDVSVGYKLINARAESVASSGAFRQSFARRRCLIPADGFYEWSKVAGHRRKQPYYVHRVDNEPLAFAGLWAVWRGPGGPTETMVGPTVAAVRPLRTRPAPGDPLPTRSVRVRSSRPTPTPSWPRCTTACR